jgi:hypothetical protein
MPSRSPQELWPLRTSLLVGFFFLLFFALLAEQPNLSISMASTYTKKKGKNPFWTIGLPMIGFCVVGSYAASFFHETVWQQREKQMRYQETAKQLPEPLFPSRPFNLEEEYKVWFCCFVIQRERERGRFILAAENATRD